MLVAPPGDYHRVGRRPRPACSPDTRATQHATARLRYRATRQGRYRANGRNTLKIALKCAIVADSEAELRPTPPRGAG